ncbi:hypothetical protein BDR07DRAFT_1484357 [Suillus spraguei]|nr:hypothetical protein BDR07DRAFT_1484357 [Suillus spraguei]
MSKPKAKAAQTHQMGIYKSDSVRDVAESLGIANLSETVASSLASDVKYRIHQVIEALRVLNIEPLYGHNPHNPPVFRRTLPFQNVANVGPVYFMEDEEIDFDRVLREEKITLPKGVSWTAHWLAVEGVQPLIPENPPAILKDVDQEITKSPPQANGVFLLTTQ